VEPLEEILAFIFLFSMGCFLIYWGYLHVKDPQASIKIMTQKWNLYNLRFVGLVMMLVGMFFIFLTVAKIRDPNINRKPPNPNTKPYLVNP
jgi:hypothetical protein